MSGLTRPQLGGLNDLIHQFQLQKEHFILECFFDHVDHFLLSLSSPPTLLPKCAPYLQAKARQVLICCPRTSEQRLLEPLD